MKFEQIIERIIAINHAWKLARDDFGKGSPITISLREQKSSWQANLLRLYPEASFLALATDSNMHDEDLYSVRLIKPVKTSIGLKNDAEHIPKRLAESLFTNQELNKYFNKDV